MYLFLIGALAGFLFWKLFAGKYEGDRSERSFRFLLGNYWIHLHHWFWCLIILLALRLLDIKSSLLFGIFVGSIVQGLTYGDWYYLVYHKSREEKLYSRFKKGGD